MKDITPEDSVTPIYLVPLTAEEKADRKKMQAELTERESAEEAKLVAKESARAKLAALGLTEAEIQALIGA